MKFKILFLAYSLSVFIAFTPCSIASEGDRYSNSGHMGSDSSRYQQTPPHYYDPYDSRYYHYDPHTRQYYPAYDPNHGHQYYQPHQESPSGQGFPSDAERNPQDQPTQNSKPEEQAQVPQPDANTQNSKPEEQAQAPQPDATLTPEVEEAFTQLEIKEAPYTLERANKAFRKLALKYHPDRNNAPEAESQFKEINSAIEKVRNHFGVR